MTVAIVSAPGSPVRSAFARTAAVSTLAFFLGSGAFAPSVFAPSALAQQPPAPAPAPAAPPAPRAPKPAPKPQPKAQPAPQAQPPQPAPQQQQTADQMPPMIYSPWTKFCGKEQTPQGLKEVCITVRESRLDTGQPMAAFRLVEVQGEATKVLHISLPLGMQLPQGMRLMVDKDEPINGRYILCIPAGCVAQLDINPELIARMKKGQEITIQGINMQGQMISFQLPLADFAKANEGPPSDPKVLEEQGKKLQEELQRKAEEARKRLERQNGGQGAPATPAPAR
jgi:invasion protein IalB